MDYNSFLIYIILFLIFSTVVFTLYLSMAISINVLAYGYKAKDLFAYYIYNMRFSIFCASAYILFFIIILYGLRLWNINRTLDLRVPYYAIISFFQLPLVIVIPSLILGFFIVVNILLYIVRIQKYCLHHIYIIYLYIRYNENTPLTYWFFAKIAEPADEDFISYYIYKLSYTINNYIFQDYEFNGFSWKDSRAKIPWYFLSLHIHKTIRKITRYGKPSGKYYERFVTFSPLLVVLYDCFYNDFIITHLYYYLLLYIPLILWKRVTYCIIRDAIYICKALCNIYYKKETCIYAIREDHKNVLDLYLMSGLKFNIDLDIEIEISLANSLCFNPDTDEYNVYCNNEGILLERTANTKLVRKITNEDEEVLTEEWILLVDKHHFINNDKYKTLVFIN